MSNFQKKSIFYFLLPISLVDTKTTYQSWSVTSCLLAWQSQRNSHSNGNWEQVYRAFCTLCKFENIFNGLSGTWIGRTHIEHLLNTCECTWKPMSERWTPPEHPLSVHGCQWVSGNTPWTPIECTWQPLNECECPLSAHDHLWVILNATHHVRPWESSHLCQNWTHPECLWVRMNVFESVLNTPWLLVSAPEHLGVSTKHALNACECTRMPMSEWEHPLNTHWVRMNAFE